MNLPFFFYGKKCIVLGCRVVIPKRIQYYELKLFYNRHTGIVCTKFSPEHMYEKTQFRMILNDLV